MARLNKTSPDVVAYYDLLTYVVIPDIDLCQDCFDAWKDNDEGKDYVVDHPPYEEQDPPLECFDCGTELTKDDN